MSRRALTALTMFALTVLVCPDVPASMSVYMPPEKLAEISPVIVEGTVTRVASGYDSATRSLATYVTLDLLVVHRGPSDMEQVVVRELGGRYRGMVHHVDAVPVYRAGERVFAFLQPARDGALRTSGMFFGKYSIEGRERGSDRAVRDLSGQGHITGRGPKVVPEALPANQLAAIAASVQLRDDRHGTRGARAEAKGNRPAASRTDARWLSSPPELARLSWDDIQESPRGASALGAGSSSTFSGTGLERGGGADPVPLFTPLSSSSPTRWHESDDSIPLVIDIERAGNPLGDGPAAAFEMGRAMAAWTDVPEARIALQTGDDDASFTASNSSPTQSYPPTNIILFDDPYDDIADPSGCSGVLAIGGYWRSSSPTRSVNNVSFFPARRLYVIFNNNFECYLGDADNLAEVATHEVGHGLGFGHSTVADAVMRSSAYGGRGPRLGDDDRDAAHCHYPHTLTVLSPGGGDSLGAGTAHAIRWATTSESGPDPGSVDVELSLNGGEDWSPISSGEANDGAYTWTVPDLPGAETRVRVIRHNRVSPTPAPYPSACSQGTSGGSFTIEGATPVAGTAPDGATGAAVRIENAPGGDLVLTWGASCSDEATEYAIYEGSLTALRSGAWDHAPVVCAAGTDLTETITPGAGSLYYLVAPTAGSVEGHLGVSSSGAERPPSASACAPREDASCS